MAKRDSTTTYRSGRVSKPAATLEDIIEGERIRLMKAHAVLGCASIALDQDYGPSSHQPDYAHVIDVARDMIHETTVQLDSAYLQHFYERIQEID